MSTELTTANFPVLSPMGSLDAYIGHVNRLPMLTLDEEQSLARRLREEDDVDAARDLILSHLRFVVHVARGYKGYGLAIGDLIQEGNIGLMKAVKRFDPDVGVRLVSFAVHWIRAEMHEFILKNWRIVKVATTKAQRKLFFNLRKSKKRLGWLNSGEVAAVAEALSVKPSDVLEMEKRLSGRDIAFDQPADTDDDSAPAPAFFLPHADDDPESIVVANDYAERRSSALSDGLAVLDARSRDIVERRWLGSDRETLQTLADEYGVSAERIRQIEAAAMKKIRTVIEA